MRLPSLFCWCGFAFSSVFDIGNIKFLRNCFCFKDFLAPTAVFKDFQGACEPCFLALLTENKLGRNFKFLTKIVGNYNKPLCKNEFFYYVQITVVTTNTRLQRVFCSVQTCSLVDVNQPLPSFSRVGQQKILSPFLEHYYY